MKRGRIIPLCITAGLVNGVVFGMLLGGLCFGSASLGLLPGAFFGAAGGLALGYTSRNDYDRSKNIR
ncbi:MAG: hypothetical protein PUA81_07245 [Oscillospiraceae bacterium]|nr:hypothetical protein [Oscillospiraceae bacterium]